MLVAAGDVNPLIGADSLGGDVLTDSLGIGIDLLLCSVSFHLMGKTPTRTLETTKTLPPSYLALNH